MLKKIEVLILGAGPAGLSAAMSIGRMGRSAIIFDDGRPRNAAAAHMNNFVSHDGLNPSEWRQKARNDLAKYPTLQFSSEKINLIKKRDSEFEVKLESGTVTFRKVVLAYGVQDQMLAIPGYRELWGKSLFHCPYCHGYEIRQKKLGLVANGKLLEHLAPMIYGLSKDLVVFSNGPSELEATTKAIFEQNKIRLIEDEIVALEHVGEELKAVHLGSGKKIERDGIFVAPKLPFQLKSQVGDELGCEKNEMGFLKTDMFAKTTVSNVFAAGDITSPMHSVLAAAASGQFAGASAVAELLNEDFRTSGNYSK